jgi:hypothetical protein
MPVPRVELPAPNPHKVPGNNNKSTVNPNITIASSVMCRSYPFRRLCSTTAFVITRCSHPISAVSHQNIHSYFPYMEAISPSATLTMYNLVVTRDGMRVLKWL